MKDYNIEDAQKILKSHNLKNKIKLKNHVLDNWFKRGYSLNYIFDCLTNKIPLSISKTRENRFKMIYPHETNSNDDLYIIIEINDDREVSVITAYSFNKRRREREKER